VRALVILAHPDADSFCSAAAQRAISALEAAGHEVDVVDLYAIGYQPAMTEAERRGYEGLTPVVDPVVASHVELVKRSEIIVFVYPTWWSGLPAILKGWMDRTLVPGVAFVLDPATNRVRPGLTHVRHLVGISTYGSPWAYVRIVNDNGRRTIARTLRLATRFRARITWLPHYSTDTSSATERAAFLDRITTTLGALR
jgi:NAD(P)H dehydrogenase (quinone)